MPDKVTYYAIVDDLSSREQPAGVFRRIYFETGGRRDEAFTTRSRLETELISRFRRAGRLGERVHRDQRGRGEPADGGASRPLDRRGQRLTLRVRYAWPTPGTKEPDDADGNQPGDHPRGLRGLAPGDRPHHRRVRPRHGLAYRGTLRRHQRSTAASSSSSTRSWPRSVPGSPAGSVPPGHDPRGLRRRRHRGRPLGRPRDRQRRPALREQLRLVHEAATTARSSTAPRSSTASPSTTSGPASSPAEHHDTSPANP